MNWRIIFTRWWNRHGGNANLTDLEDAFRAGWKAALRNHLLTHPQNKKRKSVSKNMI